MTASAPSNTLVLGGARSGKSRHAEGLGRAHGGAMIYIATGEAGDAEMARRIAHHRAARGPAWTTIEEPVDLAQVLERAARPQQFVLVDCITLWITNLMARGHPVGEAVAERADLCLVSNEVGLGIVPDNPLARQFRDEAGQAHQRLAAVCQHVVFMVGGLPITVK